MKNFVNKGDTITLAAPYARSSGQGALVGSLFGVAVGDVANGVDGEFVTRGVFDLTAAAATTATVGAKAYWDNTNKEVTATSTSNTLIGTFLVAKVADVTTARVRLNGTV